MKWLVVLAFLTGCHRDHQDGASLGTSALTGNSPAYSRTVNVLVGGQSNNTLMVDDRDGTATYFRMTLRRSNMDSVLSLNAHRSSSQQDWMPGSAYYNEMLDAGKRMGHVEVLLWWQGEAEGATMIAGFDAQGQPIAAGSPQPLYVAQAWAQNFTRMVNQLKLDLGQPDLKVIFCQIGPNPGGLDSWDEVRRQQELVYLPNVYMVKTDDQDFGGWFHTNESGYRTIGTRMAFVFLEHS